MRGGREVEEKGECMNRCAHVHPSKMKRDTPCPTWHPKIWAHWQYIIISRPPHACTLLFNRDVKYGSLIPSELQSAGGQDIAITKLCPRSLAMLNEAWRVMAGHETRSHVITHR